ncbi:RagB/SusD family nutrient uptake outer membrane protein [Pedobacter punctiformis]|uniref:RagB/SusD family nutrient uptake outer membrane protein n=1 Tax=Pedobacter punctiformis TaxID=3004097 RepID=A0ABT4L5R3_9SPHI|nr:RagB/SusD family nutrient uptake outer membrane protein [Pedobacter sp. HCMS5-2]MCZ4243278.1 RagB/SusD family nutrient uptake outer membrane protein [Pedobacter sp. HCMS5-2]
MKKINKLYIPLLVLVLTMGACKKDYLQTNPTDAVAYKDVFATTTNAMAALNGIHRSLYIQYSRQEEGGQGAVNLNIDYMGDDIVNTVSTTAYGVHKWVTHRSASNLNNSFIYTFYYRIIANANQIIDNIDNAEGSAADKKAIKGEALTYRAWAHFVLVQVFGKRYDAAGNNTQPGVPLIITSKVEGSSGKPRASVEEVYTQINADIDAAIASFSGATARPNKSHFNINVAKGIKARIALTQGKWAVAAQNALEARTGLNLMTNAEYLGGFNSYDNQEWMWGSRQQEDQTTYFYSFFAYLGTFNSTANRTVPKRMNSVLYNQIAATDVRKALWDPTGNSPTFLAYNQPVGVVSNATASYKQGKFRNAGSTSVGDVVNMRVGEMFLIEAEARARLGIAGAAAETTTAQNVLFTLAKNRNPNYVLTTNTGTALLNEILIQRRIELWGEGFRFFDLKRQNLPLDRTGGNATIALSGVLSVPAGGPEWQWAIPQAEIDANPAIGPGGQNP